MITEIFVIFEDILLLKVDKCEYISFKGILSSRAIKGGQNFHIASVAMLRSEKWSKIMTI